ncbi:heme-binding protein, partial [Cobetia sp.]
MITRHVLTLADVNQMLDAAQKEAEANGWAVSIAVADDGGHPLGLRRLDDTPAMTGYFAQEKAKSAALGRRETQLFEDSINGGRTAFLSAPQLEGMLGGGVPVMVEGQIAGSIGVSGVKPEQDA